MNVVHTLYEHNARQIPECMSDLAQKIKSGGLGQIGQAVCVIQDDKGRLGLFLWGDMNSREAHSLLERASFKLCLALDEGELPHELVPAC